MSRIPARHGLFQDTGLHLDDTGGDGRPVVLIHGWPLSGEAFSAQVPDLVAAGYRVITYDRRGFGRSEKPESGFDYDTLTGDLHLLLEGLDLTDVTLVGFSMGGGEVARYFSAYGTERLRSVVFASAVPPFLLSAPDNPDGPLSQQQASSMARDLMADDVAFYESFATQFFSVDGAGELKVTAAQREDALRLCLMADKRAALACMESFGTTDFRDDLRMVSLPTLVLHGDRDGVVPFSGSGQRTHEAIPESELHLISGAPHGANVSHQAEWNQALIDFLAT